jgi:hypothetical protein
MLRVSTQFVQQRTVGFCVDVMCIVTNNTYTVQIVIDNFDSVTWMCCLSKLARFHRYLWTPMEVSE